MVFLSKEQVLELFKNAFDIIEFNEVEKERNSKGCSSARRKVN